MKRRYDIQKILTGCLNEEPRFQRALVDQYSGLLYAICCRYLRQKEEARDILQESLLRIFQNLDKYDKAKGSFEAWTTTVVIRLCLNKLSKKKLDLVSDEEILSRQASYEIESDILSNYDMEQLTKFVTELPESYRVVFNLSAIDGYAHKEIAKLIGITEVASRTRLNRAKNILKDRITRLIKTESWVDTI